jgi:hypothetical protein
LAQRWISTAERQARTKSAVSALNRRTLMLDRTLRIETQAGKTLEQ